MSRATVPTALDRRNEVGEPALDARGTPVRHVEKRRTGTCAFADRVAKLSLGHYMAVVPLQYRTRQPQTCVATVVAHVRNRNATANPPSNDSGERMDELAVVALGVGTKFLTEATLRAATTDWSYGDRVRDCHAEVLAKRAFRRHLLLEILHDLRGTSAPNCRCSAGSQSAPSPIRLLERVLPFGAGREDNQDDLKVTVRYRLRRGVTLHLYCSSAPCGNAVLKRLCTMKRETFQTEWKSDEWPSEPHPNILPGHSQQLGQFVLLCKKDNSPGHVGESAFSYQFNIADTRNRALLSSKEASWPCHKDDNWCPAGTTTAWTGRGSLHTCSDKIARWNMLGLQGGYVAPFLSNPLFLSTLVVGRKFSSVTCRRAVCCRLGNDQRDVTPTSTSGDTSALKQSWASKYQVNHPAVLGTGVYMDENGVIDAVASNEVGQDVRFHSTQCWAWWPGLDVAECIDGSTGLQRAQTSDGEVECSSLISSSSFVHLVLDVQASMRGDPEKSEEATACSSSSLDSLALLRKFKQEIAPEYEEVKATLLAHHPVLRNWIRRSHGTSTAAV